MSFEKLRGKSFGANFTFKSFRAGGISSPKDGFRRRTKRTFKGIIFRTLSNFTRLG